MDEKYYKICVTAIGKKVWLLNVGKPQQWGEKEHACDIPEKQARELYAQILKINSSALIVPVQK